MKHFCVQRIRKKGKTLKRKFKKIKKKKRKTKVCCFSKWKKQQPAWDHCHQGSFKQNCWKRGLISIFNWIRLHLFNHMTGFLFVQRFFCQVGEDLKEIWVVTKQICKQCKQFIARCYLHLWWYFCILYVSLLLAVFFYSVFVFVVDCIFVFRICLCNLLYFGFRICLCCGCVDLGRLCTT